MPTKRLLLMCVVLATITISAAADVLTFTGGTPSTSGYVGLVSASDGSFTLVAPITSLNVSSVGNFSENTVLALQTGAGTPAGTNQLSYSTGTFALYDLSNWNFTTESGTSPLMSGNLGTGLVAYLQPTSDPSLFATAFVAHISSGTFFGSFGGYNLTTNNPIEDGATADISLDLAANTSGVVSVPLATELVVTPEPSSLLLFATGIGTLFFRKRRR